MILGHHPEFPQTKRPQRGQKYCQRLALRFHHLSKCTVNCLDKSEQRGFKQTKRPQRGQKCCQRGERNRSPSPTPAGGPVAKPEITSSGRVTLWRPGNVVGPQRHWGVGRDHPLCQPRR